MYTFAIQTNRRGAGVAERGSLLRSCTLTGTGGSNPFLSAENNTCILCKNVSFAKVSGYSVARLSRLLWEQEVAGSNPATPTKVNYIGTSVTCHRLPIESAR